jgi:uncharacterized membrane protein YfcA
VEVVAAVAVLFGAIAQAVTGFGFSLVSAPFLVAAYGAPTGVQLNLLLSTALNLLLLAGGRRHLDGRAAGRLLVPAVVATVVVGTLIRGSQDDRLTVVAGLLCLVGVVAVARGRSLRRITGVAGTIVVGALSGAINVVAGIGGPPVVLFGTTAGWSPEVARPTLQAFFLGINVVGLATLGLPGELPLGLVAGGVVGLVLGQVAARRLDAAQVRTAVLVTAGAGSLLAVVRGLT